MAFTKVTDPVDNITTQPNKPIIGATALKALFDEIGKDLKTYINDTLVKELESTTDGDSGLDNIGMTLIAGLVATTPQAALEELNAKAPLNIADGSITDAKLSNTAGQIKDVVYNHTLDLSDRGLNLKSYGMVLDGVFDNTTLLQSALNLNYVSYFAPPGTYLFTDTVSVNALFIKKITGSVGTVFKIQLPTSKTFLDLFSNVEFSFIDFDFTQNDCSFAIRYRENFGYVKLNNLNFYNLNDIDNLTASTMIYIPCEGNYIDLFNIKFSNLKKRGNGIETDGPGSMGCVFYGGSLTTTDALGGEIKNIRLDEVHNVNNLGDIITEDTSGIYIGTEGKPSHILIDGVVGVEYGKRLLKIQSSFTTIKNVYGYTTKLDSLSVLGILSQPGLFVCTDNYAENIKSYGIISFAVACDSANSLMKDIVANVTTTGPADFTARFGIFLTENSGGTVIDGFSITGSIRPIGLSLLAETKNITIKNGKIVPLNIAFGSIIMSSGFGFNGLTLENIVIEDLQVTTGAQPLISGMIGKSSKNLKILNVEFITNRTGNELYKAVEVIDTTRVYINGLIVRPITSTMTITSPIIVSNCSDVTIMNVENLCNSAYQLEFTTVTKARVENYRKYITRTADLIVNLSTEIEVSFQNPILVSYGGSQVLGEILTNKGTTTQRPTRRNTGYSYFDTTLGIPIVYNGTNWVNSVGVIV